MYCSECGKKNKIDSIFCEGCGAKLEKEEAKKATKKTNKKVEEPIKEEVVKHPMSKKKKVLICFIAVLIISLIIAYKIGENLTNPKTIAKDYIVALIKNDTKTIYKYMDLQGDKTFVSEKVFKNVYKEKFDDENEITNYKIKGVEYSDLTAKVKFTYTTKSSNSEKIGTVKLVKEKGKKYLVFDSWKISDMNTSELTLEDYTIKVPSSSKLVFAGIEVKDKYLDKKESTDSTDVYVLPRVFKTKTELKAVLSNGFEIEEEVTPSDYYDVYTVRFDVYSLTDKQKEEIIDAAKEALTGLYNNAIAAKTYDEIKDSYSKASSEFAQTYNSFETSLQGASNKLTAIEFKEGRISSLDIDDDGNFKVSVRIDYNYTIEYTDYNNQVQTSNSSDYDYMTIILGNKDGEYYLVDAESLETYFY